MMTLNKETAIQKISEMPVERVSKLLIFMAGMEAEQGIKEKSEKENQYKKNTNERKNKNRVAHTLRNEHGVNSGSATNGN